MQTEISYEPQSSKAVPDPDPPDAGTLQDPEEGMAGWFVWTGSVAAAATWSVRWMGRRIIQSVLDWLLTSRPA